MYGSWFSDLVGLFSPSPAYPHWVLSRIPTREEMLRRGPMLVEWVQAGNTPINYEDLSPYEQQAFINYRGSDVFAGADDRSLYELYVESGYLLPGEYSYGSLTWLAYKNMVPTDAQLTLEENPPRICIDMESEHKLQNQRKFAMYIGGPSVFVAGTKVGGLFGTFVMALGAACTAWHYTAYRKVTEVTGVK